MSGSSVRERRKQIIERTLREWNYLDEEENVLADAPILDALASDESADRVWIVWHDEYDATYPLSIHDTEAGAKAEAERIALEDWSTEKAAHDAREARRLGNAGTWRYSRPEQLAPDWVPARKQDPAPFDGRVSDLPTTSRGTSTNARCGRRSRLT